MIFITKKEKAPYVTVNKTNNSKEHSFLLKIGNLNALFHRGNYPAKLQLVTCKPTYNEVIHNILQNFNG